MTHGAIAQRRGADREIGAVFSGEFCSTRAGRAIVSIFPVDHLWILIECFRMHLPKNDTGVIFEWRYPGRQLSAGSAKQTHPHPNPPVEGAGIKARHRAWMKHQDPGASAGTSHPLQGSERRSLRTTGSDRPDRPTSRRVGVGMGFRRGTPRMPAASLSFRRSLQKGRSTRVHSSTARPTPYIH